MAQGILLDLLEGNREHVAALPDDYFGGVQDAQHPPVVSVCCSDSRVSQEGMFAVDEPGWLFAPSNIGNQVWDERDGERIVDGSLLYPILHAGTACAVVIGHTGCGAVTAAYRAVTEGDRPDAPGIRQWIESLEPVVEEALAGPVDDDETVIDQLVEYNVREQTAYLRAAEVVPDEVDVFGFVYDFHARYGDDPGRTYLVDYRGITDSEAIAAELPESHADAARSLLD